MIVACTIMMDEVINGLNATVVIGAVESSKNPYQISPF